MTCPYCTDATIPQDLSVLCGQPGCLLAVCDVCDFPIPFGQQGDADLHRETGDVECQHCRADREAMDRDLYG